jgi:hypothetical protein
LFLYPLEITALLAIDHAKIELGRLIAAVLGEISQSSQYAIPVRNYPTRTHWVRHNPLSINRQQRSNICPNLCYFSRPRALRTHTSSELRDADIMAREEE